MNNRIPLLVMSLFFICCSKDSADLEITDNPYIPSAKQMETDILNTINDYRLSNNLSEIKTLPIIKSQTYKHANWMATNDTIYHYNYIERVVSLRQYTGTSSVSETLAYGYTSPETLVKAWINNMSHRRIIEGNYTHFNISAEQNDDGNWYYCNIFILL